MARSILRARICIVTQQATSWPLWLEFRIAMLLYELHITGGSSAQAGPWGCKAWKQASPQHPPAWPQMYWKADTWAVMAHCAAVHLHIYIYSSKATDVTDLSGSKAESTQHYFCSLWIHTSTSSMEDFITQLSATPEQHTHKAMACMCCCPHCCRYRAPENQPGLPHLSVQTWSNCTQ